MTSSRGTACTVFIAAEGPSELGDLGRPQWRPGRPREGYFQPLLRKLLGAEVSFDGQKITLLGRFDAKKKLRGHADRAAKALALAAQNDDCRVVVFAHDVDRSSGQKRSSAEGRRRVLEMRAEIEQGFASVRGAEHMAKLKATPLRMIEAWALGDAEAVKAQSAKRGDDSAIPKRPEETWGRESDPSSGHPKCVLRRALGREPTPEDFADLAARSEVSALRHSCPDSFGPFADEAEEAARWLVIASIQQR